MRALARGASRLKRFALIWYATRNRRLAIYAARIHAMEAGANFLRTGGTLDFNVCAYKGTDLRLRPEDWWCGLGALVRLVDNGVRFVKADDSGYSLVFPTGVHFDLDRDEVIGTMNTLVERFIDLEYESLNVAGKVVVDIGASVGDSLVYFARQGALHVYGYEPFHATFQSAIHNVLLNGYGDAVTVYNVGISGITRTTSAQYIPQRSPALTTVAMLREALGPSDGGSQEIVRLIPLAQVISEVRALHPATPLVCKMDCEGCEFEAFDTSPPETLADVDEWLIEYHYFDPISLRARFEEAGFRVDVAPQTAPVGYVYATRSFVQNEVRTQP